MTNSIPVITVDGPSGSGKGTISQQCAKALGWGYLDSGALYRVLGLAASMQGISLDDEVGLAELARHLAVAFTHDIPAKIRLSGEDVSETIRQEAFGVAASKVSALPDVREALLERQRDFRQLPGLVTDGRDMGTVVFPDAPLKIFLTASCEQRAQRRYKQLKEKGIHVSLQGVLEELKARDARDQGRAVAPLVPADDAVVIDSTTMTIQQEVAQVLALAKQALVRD